MAVAAPLQDPARACGPEVLASIDALFRRTRADYPLTRAQPVAVAAKRPACRAAETISCETMQIHSGSGYSMQRVISGCFVDARRQSICAGAIDALALNVVARELVLNAA